MQQTRTEKLVVGQTKIGEQRGNFDGVNAVLSIYYGNLALPPIDGKLVHAPIAKYQQMLSDFLDSEEGKDYIYPTDAEKFQAMKLIIDTEDEILQRIAGSKKVVITPQESVEPKQPETKPEVKPIQQIPSYSKSATRGMRVVFDTDDEDDQQISEQEKSARESLLNQIACQVKNEPDEAYVEPNSIEVKPAEQTDDKIKMVEKQPEAIKETVESDQSLQKKAKLQTIIIAIQFILICIMSLALLRG